MKKRIVITIILLIIFLTIVIIFGKGKNNFNKEENLSATNEISFEENISDTENKMIENSHTQITTDNYGEYVDLETNLIVSDNIPLEDGSIPKTDWRIFHKDENGGVYLILSDYLPYSYEATVNSGLSESALGFKNNWKSEISRVDLLNKLNDESKWNKLLPEKYIKLGMKVTGALTLDTWIESWNAKGYTKLYISKKTETKDGLEAYYVDTVENSISKYIDVRLDAAGYGNALYFPHKTSTARDTVYAYTLATPSAYGDDYLMNISLCGSVFYDPYNHDYDGVRPVIYIPSEIKLVYNDDVWKIQ